MLSPPPVVIDADVLLRNVEYAVRRGYAGALTSQASTGYSTLSGVVLFASADVAEEVQRHLPDVAARRGVEIDAVKRVWNDRFAKAVRFVDVPEWLIDDPRIVGSHPKDQHTARLACLLAPAVLATDNRKHFKSFGLADTKTDAVAVDLAKVGQFVTGAKGAAVFPTLTGAITIDGSKKVIEKLGRNDALLIGLVLLGVAVLFLTSERGRAMRAKLSDIAIEVGPQLAQLVAETSAAEERVHAFAIDGCGRANAVALLARRLAIAQPTMTTVEVAEWLTDRNLHFGSGRTHRIETRAWLLRTPCFEEISRGRWALGRYRLCA